VPDSLVDLYVEFLTRPRHKRWLWFSGLPAYPLMDLGCSYTIRLRAWSVAVSQKWRRERDRQARRRGCCCRKQVLL